MKNNKQKELGRILPHSVEAEEAVLGCMLINTNAVPKAIQILEKNSFYSTTNQIIFDSMVELFDHNKTIDYVSITDQLKKSITETSFITNEERDLLTRYRFHTRNVSFKIISKDKTSSFKENKKNSSWDE